MPATLGTAYVRIIPSAQDISSNITKELEGGGGGGVEKAGVSAGNSFGKSLMKTVAALGIGKIAMDGVKAAFSEGAALQQSFGGLETLYGDAAEGAKKYAQQAAAIGVSANSYAEQAVSFGAALKQSFGGDTTKAMEAANTAIMDMTDNAAKMGTPIESIQTAYQGFAKGQYQLLDNLKLGYGGTKGEMERLLKDAQAITGQKYDIDNLGDVYDAIHVIQGELGLTGVAAEEARSTFSGSFGAMSAAAKNFFGALTTGGDVAGTLSTLIDSAVVFVQGNVLPMLGEMLSSLPGALQTVLSQYGPAAGEALIGMFQQGLAMLPQVFEGISDRITGAIDMIETSDLIGKGLDLIKNLAQGVINAIPSLVSSIAQVVARAVSFIAANLPQFMKKGFEILTSIRQGIMEKLPELGQTALSLVTNLITTITAHLPEILQTGISLLGQFLAGILNGIPKIPGTVVNIISAIVSAFNSMDWGEIGKRILDGVMNGLKSLASSVGPAVKNIVSAIDRTFNFSGMIAKVRNAFNNIKNAIKNPIETARSLVSNAVSRIKGLFPLSIGRIFSSLKLPHISVSGGTPPYGIGGLGSLPHFSVSWYKKAENNPYIFTDATLFGAGERNDEILYGRAALMKDISAAVGNGGGAEITNYITVNGAEDPEEWASKFARQMKIQMRMA